MKYCFKLLECIWLPGGANAPRPPVSQLGGRSTPPRPPRDQITDGPFGLPSPGPHHTSLSAKFHPVSQLFMIEKRFFDSQEGSSISAIIFVFFCLSFGVVLSLLLLFGLLDQLHELKKKPSWQPLHHHWVCW